MEALILDDEINCAESLYLLLKKNCPEVNVVALETEAEDALRNAFTLKPELIFIDVELRGINAFDFLIKLNYPFEFILTTAYDRYALKALKFEALDYLLKPIDGMELVAAVEKAKNKLGYHHKEARVTSAKPFYLEKIAVPYSEGLAFLDLASIIRFQADGSYTHVVDSQNNNLLVSKNLSAIQDMITYGGFIRVHKSHIINVRHIVKYLKGEGGEVLLSNGEKVPIARDRKDSFLEAIQEMLQ